MRSYCGPDENRTHHRNIASVSRRSLGTCQPIKKWNRLFIRDFTDGLFPITWLMCTSEQGPKQSTLGHLCLSVWVANPMEPRFLSSVQVGLLSVSFRAGTRNRTEISTLEVWGNDRYTIPAVVTTPWEVSSRFTWKGWSNPLTSRV